MTEVDKKAADGAALWGRARASTIEGLSDAAAGIDALDLAAYLDGRGDESLRARVEAALAASPEGLDLLVAARDALDAGTMAAPDALVARAQALVSESRARPAGWLGRLAPLLPIPQVPRRALTLATATAGFLLISVAGFELGRAEYAYNAQVDGLVANELDSFIGQGGEDLL